LKETLKCLADRILIGEVSGLGIIVFCHVFTVAGGSALVPPFRSGLATREVVMLAA
jgi:hypothetical protein